MTRPGRPAPTPAAAVRGARAVPGVPGGVVVGLALALAFTATACSATGAPTPGRNTPATGTGTGAPGPLITPAQALQRMDTLLQETTAGIQPPLRTWDAWPNWREKYSTGLDEHSLGYATTSRERHVMTKVAAGRYEALLDAVRTAWRAKGYVVQDGPGTPTLRAVSATAPDGSTVGIGINPDTTVIDISATSGPIAVPQAGQPPFGTPTPDPTMSNGNPDVVPDHDDPYWSH
ncbi:hypothetical protein [Kitasatospora sp. NPDC048538]|uniref:hypothetical protein n=1 Tax=unclassified Kitasatospora TaxID=2633591 RepID=UPI0033F532E6